MDSDNFILGTRMHKLQVAQNFKPKMHAYDLWVES